MKHRPNDLVEISTVIPLWLVPIVKLFSSGFFFNIGTDIQSKIEEMTHREEYDSSLKFIQEAEKEWGASSFTVRLETRISRMRAIGK